MLKSATIYQLTLPAATLLERLPDALRKLPFKKCPKASAMSRGFVPPLPSGEEIIYSANGGTLFCLRTDTKTVPASAVKERVNEKRAKAESAGKEFSAVDADLAKEEAIAEFLPGIPPATRLTYGYIDSQLGMLFLGATDKAADDFTEALGNALKARVPLTLLGIEGDPSEKFTAWVKDSNLLGHAFTLGMNGSLKHPGTQGGCGIINAKHEDFESSEMLSLIEAGRQVCSIALEHERFDFRLTASLGLRNIALSEAVKAEGFDEVSGETTLANEFAAFVVAMRAVIGSLEPLLGGWPKQELLDLQEDAA